MTGLRFERALRDAFANGDFELHYQPEYAAALGRWVAAEAAGDQASTCRLLAAPARPPMGY